MINSQIRKMNKKTKISLKKGFLFIFAPLSQETHVRYLNKCTGVRVSPRNDLFGLLFTFVWTFCVPVSQYLSTMAGIEINVRFGVIFV